MPIYDKPQTIKQMKAQEYSTTFWIQEQRSNFNDIDTCNVTQYCNFKLDSIFLEEFMSRSLSNCPNTNAISPEGHWLFECFGRTGYVCGWVASFQ